MRKGELKNRLLTPIAGWTRSLTLCVSNKTADPSPTLDDAGERALRNKIRSTHLRTATSTKKRGRLPFGVLRHRQNRLTIFGRCVGGCSPKAGASRGNV